MKKNIDEATVRGFGDEWAHFDQSALAHNDAGEIFSEYFRIFPWHKLPADAIGFDMGCGSGRWAALVAPKVGQLHCIDASAAALDVARRNLQGSNNVSFHVASVESIPLPDGTADFGYSLGVLHHVPDTARALRSCAQKLKPGAPFLVYLYYRFDNKPVWYRMLWKASDFLRTAISAMPFAGRLFFSQCIALFVYWPFARSARLGEAIGLPVTSWPLSYYRNRGLYVMRTDALDRFGTRLEQRFTRREIESLLLGAGFSNVEFSDSVPFWCAVAIRSLVKE